MLYPLSYEGGTCAKAVGNLANLLPGALAHGSGPGRAAKRAQWRPIAKA